jgi:hypothetical protein
VRTRIVLALVASCGSDENLAGTYVGTATGSYQLATDARSVDFTLPNETVVVTGTSRHYQGYRYDVTMRGCTVEIEGDARQASTRGASCTFDLPTIGPTTLKPSGGVFRDRGASGIHVSMANVGLDGKVKSFSYRLDAKPKSK